MDNEKYLLKLQQTYLEKSKLYMSLIMKGKKLSELSELAMELRSIIAEIKAVKEDIQRKHQP